MSNTETKPKRARKPDTRKKLGPAARAKLKAQREAAASAIQTPETPPAATPVAPKASKAVSEAPKRSARKALAKLPKGKVITTIPVDKREAHTKQAAMVMAKSYQRNGTVATGITIKGGGTQLTITLKPEQATRVGKYAAKQGIAMSEAIRRIVNFWINADAEGY